MSGPISPGLRSGSLPVLVALMTMLAGLALAGLTGIQALAESWNTAAQSSATIEIPTDAAHAQSRTDHLLKTLHETRGVTDTKLLTPEKVRSLLAPWLGETDDKAGKPPALSLPAVLVVRHEHGIDLEAVVHALFPEAIIEEDMRWSVRLQRLGSSLVGCAWLAVSLIAAVAVLSVGITVRRSVSAQRRAVEIIHAIGATDRQISGKIARRAAGLSLLGGIMGLAALAPILMFLARLLAPFQDQNTQPPPPADTLAAWSATLSVLPHSLLEMLASLPFLAALLGWLTAQSVVLVWLRRLP